jgi:nondiscriminating glutamyl-tRNA synthetase
MHPPEQPELAPRPNPHVASDVVTVLQKNRWLLEPPSPPQLEWATRTAALLGPYAGDRDALTAILRLIFEYDATQIIQDKDAHAVLARHGARDVIRHLAFFLLEPARLDSDRFKVLVESLKENLQLRSRDLFHPIRLALTGRSGEGELDRVILLLDDAAVLSFNVPVKSALSRILEFCAAME